MRSSRMLALVVVVLGMLVALPASATHSGEIDRADELGIGDISDDGATVFYSKAYSDAGQGLYAQPVIGGTITELVAPETGVAFDQVRVSGTRIVYVRRWRAPFPSADFNEKLYSLPLAGGSPTLLYDPQADNIRLSPFLLSPAGDVVFPVEGDGIYTVKSTGGTASVLVDDPAGGIWDPFVDLPTVIYTLGGDIYAIPASGGTSQLLAAGEDLEIRGLSNDYIVGLLNGDLYAASTGGGAATQISDTPGSLPSGGAQITPDGSTVIYPWHSGSEWEVRTVPITGGSSTLLAGPFDDTGVTDQGLPIVVSPDGANVAMLVLTEYSEDVSHTKELSVVPSSGGTVSSVGEFFFSNLDGFQQPDDASVFIFNGGTTGQTSSDNIVNAYEVEYATGAMALINDPISDGFVDVRPIPGGGYIFTTNPFSGGEPVLYSSLAEPLPPNTFTDDDGSVHEENIEKLFAAGITNGCNPPDFDHFCPGDPVTRGQMAAFLVRALGLSVGGGSDLFTDDDGTTFENDIDLLGNAGITKGCNPPDFDQFCPGGTVTRGQMAAFLVRALGLSVGGGDDLFTDDDGNTFEIDIDILGTAGITAGCNPPDFDHYCPSDDVTRAQMATFLVRALGL